MTKMYRLKRVKLSILILLGITSFMAITNSTIQSPDVKVQVYNVIATPYCIPPDGCAIIYACFHNLNDTHPTDILLVKTKLINSECCVVYEYSKVIGPLDPDETICNVPIGYVSNLDPDCYIICVEVWEGCACPSNLVGTGCGCLQVYPYPEFNLSLSILNDQLMGGSYLEYKVKLSSSMPEIEPCPPCWPCYPCPPCWPCDCWPCDCCCPICPCEPNYGTYSFTVQITFTDPSGVEVYSKSYTSTLSVPGIDEREFEYHIPVDAKAGVYKLEVNAIGKVNMSKTDYFTVAEYKPILSAEMTGPSSVDAGSEFEITVSLFNSGNAIARSIWITLETDIPEEWFEDGKQKSIGMLPPYTTATVEFPVNVPADATGTYTVKARITGYQIYMWTSELTIEIKPQTQTGGGEPSGSVEVDVSREASIIDGSLLLNIEVTSGVSVDVTVEQFVPQGLTPLTYPEGRIVDETISWDVTLTPGETSTLTCTFKILENFRGTIIIPPAKVLYQGSVIAESPENKIEMLPLITEDGYESRDAFSWTKVVTLTNSGNATSESFTYTVTLPSGYSYSSSYPMAISTGNTVQWSIPPLKPGESITLIVRASSVAVKILIISAIAIAAISLIAAAVILIRKK